MLLWSKLDIFIGRQLSTLVFLFIRIALVVYFFSLCYNIAMQQQFIVPQFIDVEDKIFGPITVRQFLIILSGSLLEFVVYKFADFQLFIFLTALIGGTTLIFAFAKVNGQTFHYFLLNLFQTLRKPSIRIWRKFYTNSELKYIIKQSVHEIVIPEAKKMAKPQRIRDLSLVVNTGGYYKEGLDEEVDDILVDQTQKF